MCLLKPLKVTNFSNDTTEFIKAVISSMIHTKWWLDGFTNVRNKVKCLYLADLSSVV
jgi:hypothetical protein